MTIDQILQLSNAGFTKADIINLAATQQAHAPANNPPANTGPISQQQPDAIAALTQEVTRLASVVNNMQQPATPPPTSSVYPMHVGEPKSEIAELKEMLMGMAQGNNRQVDSFTQQTPEDALASVINPKEEQEFTLADIVKTMNIGG